MVYSLWLGPFGWGIFFIGLVVAIILYLVKMKFAPVLYLISVATYIFTIGFIIDAFHFNKNGVLIMLAISAVLFILLGVYFSYKFQRNKEETLSRIPSRR